MQRRGGSGQPPKAQRTSRPKARKAPTAHVSTDDLQAQLDRRTRERDEALEQQAATSDILRVISTSPTDVQSVFTAIVKSAVTLCGTLTGAVWRFDGELIHLVAQHNVTPEVRNVYQATYPLPPSKDKLLGKALLECKPVNIADVLTSYRSSVGQRELGHRSVLAVPMLRKGAAIGVIATSRNEPGLFTENQVELLKTFADQAVIAIENARLFDEVQARTRELSESLEQQTATSEVLQVISRSAGKLQPVFDTMLESAVRICGAKFGILYLSEDDSRFRTVAMHDVPRAFSDTRGRNPVLTPPAGSPLGRIVRTRQVAHIADIRTESGYAESRPLRDVADLGGARTLVAVPMLKDNELVGAIVIYRQEVKLFTDKQIELVRNFAAQAVIAIENTRLLNELQQRTSDLSESLEQQTATSEILSSMSGAMTDTKPVFDAIVRNLLRLFGTRFATALLLKDGMIHLAALDGEPGFERLAANFPRPLDDSTTAGRVMHLKQVVQFAPVIDNPETPPASERFAREYTFNSILAAPMMRGHEVIGAIVTARRDPIAFDDKQIALIKSFAAQAVIAIENARLLNELRESLQQQTATADVLKVISSSRGDLKPVFEAILENAVRICEAKFGNLYIYEENFFRIVAMQNAPPAYGEFWRREPVFVVTDSSRIPLARLARARKVIQIPDLTADEAYIGRDDPRLVAIVDSADARTMLLVPMLKEGELMGTIVIYRQEVRPFGEKQIALLESFADQAVIAIENTRLLNELRERTDDLGASLESLRTTQDRLVQTQKLALLGQLTAGIAHEIKNPLNFVNNFSGISAELIDELRDTLKGVSLDDRARTEINELTYTLKSNFDKVVHHGRRADAIVKNMLQHSREGSGEHRVIDVNALVEESLNLAWHGARAETQGFEIKLKQSFDPSAGMADVFPQDIRRALLNVISNGFYAAIRRRAETNVGDYEPTLTASTKNRGDHVEIRIRDNGTGITPDVKEKMFNPFFTTKPTGEGTGLGLSISHDIIVKQHAGSIEVETKPGEFTEIRVILPRTGMFV